MAVEDYLAPEAGIVARLQEPGRLPGGWRVLTAPDLQAIREAGGPTPRVEVIYAGDAKVSSAARGGVITIQQSWVVVVCVRNVRGLRSGAAVRADAGPVIVRVLNALRGHPPAAGWGPLQPALSGWRATYRDGLAWYPVGFHTGFQLI